MKAMVHDLLGKDELAQGHKRSLRRTRETHYRLENKESLLHRLRRSRQCWCISGCTPKCLKIGCLVDAENVARCSLTNWRRRSLSKFSKRKWRRWTSSAGSDEVCVVCSEQWLAQDSEATISNTAPRNRIGRCRAQWCLPRHAVPSKWSGRCQAQDRRWQTSGDRLSRNDKDHRARRHSPWRVERARLFAVLKELLKTTQATTCTTVS